MSLRTLVRITVTGQNRGLAALAIVLTIAIPLRGEKAITRPFPSQLTTIQARDLPGDYAGVEIVDFAMSPDNAKITVVFEVAEGEKSLAAWLAEWDLSDKKLIAKTRIASHVAPGLRSTALDHDTIRYIAGGSALVCQIGHDLYVVDASALALRYSIPISDLAGGSASEVESRTFTISADESRLALFLGQSLYPYKIGFIQLYRLRTGEELARWSLPAQIQSLSLSPDGRQLLVTVLNPKNMTDILLLDGMTGHEIKSFESGFSTQQLVGAALNAVFVGADHFVATSGSSVDAKGRYLGNALKILSSQTGKVTGELTYEKLGPSGDIWVSSKDATLATLNLWMSRFKRRFNFTESGPKHAQLLFFHLNETTPLCVLGPLPEKRSDEHPRQSGFIRFSPDLGSVGLFMNRQVTVYSVPECNERGTTRAIKNGAAQPGGRKAR